MADLRIYDVVDMKPMMDFMSAHGQRLTLQKNDYFCRMNRRCHDMAVVVSGGFAFSSPDYRGHEQILSLAVDGEFIGAYIGLRPGFISAFDCVALCRSEIISVPLTEMLSFLDNQDGGRYRTELAEAIAFGFMLRGASYRCQSPEERYLELTRRVPALHTLMTNTAIASYLGISREGFARLRARLSRQR